MRIAIVKPDWQIRGGFELVVDRLVGHMRRAGHRVDIIGFDAWRVDHRPFGVRIDDEMWSRSPWFFGYLGQWEKCRALRLDRADLVVSTQPPSFGVEHPRHLSLFFHHLRPFYDLSPYVVRAGMVEPEMHELAAAAIRRLDDAAMSGVGHVLAGGESVAERLVSFNGRRSEVSLFHAGPLSGVSIAEATRGDPTHVLCVSRHDFPKRTELFVHADRLMPELNSVAVGVGGRLGRVRQLDRVLDGDVPEVIADEQLWLNDPPWVDPSSIGDRRGPTSNLSFETHVGGDRLGELYAHAHCLVAPALLEDYGLTVLEAMKVGIPVVVCRDGGHLLHFVEHERNGLIVEPTGKAIAEAARRIANDPGLREELGDAARETATAYTWERALHEFDLGIEAVMS